ncbi:zinc finger protein 721-like [Archocentrus centrarchus]|uniref:zinc finger protein 721-like n=1 Tax=Archocentrus centrarchus TaxID=63155 RepID=UPI0011E9E52C|nr:zinc finger protein 721-like [Archocentrus centrarchus]
MPRRKSLRLADPKGLKWLPPTSAPNTSDVALTQVRTDLDVQQMLLIKEEMPWSPNQDQQDPDLLDMKEEQEELLTSQEGEQHNGLEEADITRFPITAVPVKNEDNEEKPQFSHFHQSPTSDNREAEPLTSSSAKQIKAETDGEDCGGPEPATTYNPNNHLQLNIDVKISDSYETYEWQEPLSEPETEDSEESGIKSDCKKPFICSECGKQFLHNWSLQRHVRLQSRKRPSRFLVSDGQSKCSGVAVQTEEKPFGCDICGQRFKLNVNLKVHMKVHTGEKPFSCNICQRKFRHQCNLKTHMRVHTGEKPFGCGMCDKKFAQTIHLKTHMRSHTGEKPFVCEVCSKQFSRLRILKSHMRVHTGEKPFDCDVCHKRFSQLGDLKRHKLVHTGEKPFSCSVCGKRFAQRINLRTHMRVHTGEKPFGCNVCSKKFSQPGILKRHMSIHTEIKRFVLGKSRGLYLMPPVSKPVTSELVPTDIKNRRAIQQMLQIEEDASSRSRLDQNEPTLLDVPDKQEELITSQKGEQLHCLEEANLSQLHQRPTKDNIEADHPFFSCSECDKQYLYKRSLQRHKKSHSAERSSSSLVNNKCSKVKLNVVDTSKKIFGCDICDQRFNQKSHLKTHMRIHTGEKPFSCKICGNIFRHQYSLDRHIRVHTGEKPFSCGVCSKRFSHLWDLKRHKSVHTKSPQPKELKGPDLVPSIPPSATSELVQAQVKIVVDVQQMLPIKDEVPWTLSLDQQDSDMCHIKEEQEGEQLNGLDEADVPRFPFTAAAVKSEDDEEKPEFSQLHKRPADTQSPTINSVKQIKTERDEEDCGGPELASCQEINRHLQANTNGKASDFHVTDVNTDDVWHESLSSGPETEDSERGWKEGRECESAVNNGVECNTAENSLSCSDSGKLFLYTRSLQRHRKFNSGKKASRHLVNEKCFKVKQNADSDIAAYTEEKLFNCGVCGQRFNKNANLKIHIRVHTGEKPFSCNICEKTFGHHCNLKTHIRVHTGEKPFGCNLCDKKFTQRVHLKTHMSVHTGARPFVCDICSKRFSQLRILKTHMSIHTGERPFCCDKCGKRFKCNRNLKLHMNVHTEEKPFVCEICGKRLKCDRSLKIHMSIHTGEKPFGCAVCSKSFSQSGILKRHMRIHTGLTPFSCNMCGKRFKCQGNLNSHIRVHSGERPFVCDVCGKRLKSNSNLKNHLRVHTGERPFGCDICDIRFNEEGSLRRHMRCRHVVVVKDL